MNSSVQLDLFAQVTAIYACAPNGTLSNDALYDKLADRLGVSRAVMAAFAGFMLNPLLEGVGNRA
ncbi:hypothetical protein [Paraburkholderia youngii]|uniref:hypothetical protein n=1 Tax=Paraburkholderia youngii TaxID=2782701 RepID=UPI003D21D398